MPRSASALAAMLLAAAAPSIAGTAAGTYGTRDQVRQCAAEQDALDARVQQRQKAHEAHVAALARLEAESAEINRRQSMVNQDDETSVREFNQLVAAHNANADIINQKALESRTVADAYNADAIAHNQRCAGLLIRPEDLAVVTHERARVASPATAKLPRAAAAGASQAP